MSVITLGWIAGLHLTIAVWLGVLASVWKKRSTWRWIAIGLLTSFVGLILLAKSSRLHSSRRIAEVDLQMQMQHLDGTSLLQ
ncbi:MAG: hypothetical protein V4695_06495 [Pseudomonadota bacterium]